MRIKNEWSKKKVGIKHPVHTLHSNPALRSKSSEAPASYENTQGHFITTKVDDTIIPSERPASSGLLTGCWKNIPIHIPQGQREANTRIWKVEELGGWQGLIAWSPDFSIPGNRASHPRQFYGHCHVRKKSRTCSNGKPHTRQPYWSPCATSLTSEIYLIEKFG